MNLNNLRNVNTGIMQTRPHGYMAWGGNFKTQTENNDKESLAYFTIMFTHRDPENQT
jgi:hypothetical protein